MILIWSLFSLLITFPKAISSTNSFIISTSEAFYLPINALSDGDYEFIASVEGMPDLPKWMHLRQLNGSQAFLYGTPTISANLSIEVITLNTFNYETDQQLVNITIIKRKVTAKYEIQIRLINLNIEEMFDDQQWYSFLSIFRDNLWKGSKNVYFTKVALPSELGESIPVNPKDKEGIIIRIGSDDVHSRDLLNLEREIEPIKNRSPCPRRYKLTSVEHLFRSKNFICDWCSFQIIKAD